jgi:hypothetical protein
MDTPREIKFSPEAAEWLHEEWHIRGALGLKIATAKKPAEWLHEELHIRGVLEPAFAIGKKLAERLPGELDLRGELELMVAKLEKLYQITGNPLHFWTAYRLCRVARLEMPDWVLSYLDGVAKGLLGETAQKCKKLSESAIVKALGRALGMKAPGRQFRHFTETPEWVEIADDVWQQLKWGDKQKYPTKEMFATETVAKERGIKPITVYRAWAKAKKWFPELSNFKKLPKTNAKN